MARHSRRNDGSKEPQGPRKSWSPAPDRERRPPRKQGPGPTTSDWLWGWHAVTAALANPARGPARRLVATADQAKRLAGLDPRPPKPEILDAAAIAHLLPANAVHQGVAVRPGDLEGLSLTELAQPAAGVLVMLDQVTDPQNVGAVFRSAAAFGARGVILQDRHAPPFAGALAKAAAGALDAVPTARVVNLARALEELEELGWRAVGLAGDAPDPLHDMLDGRPTVLVLGSEGEGLRRLVSEHCDALARIPMPGGFESLNVAAAAAVALYEASRQKR